MIIHNYHVSIRYSNTIQSKIYCDNLCKCLCISIYYIVTNVSISIFYVRLVLYNTMIRNIGGSRKYLHT